MPTSDPRAQPGAIVRVPFPYTNAETRQRRPALVIATAGGEDAFLLWVLMITASENRPWGGDVAIPDFKAAGLPIPSTVRTAKIATIDTARAEVRGGITAETLAAVRAEIAHRLRL
jgi:mRNA interferase MazF